MKCSIVTADNGARAIVCGSRRYQAKRCKCGRLAEKLCDWIIQRPLPSLAGAIAVSSLTTCDAPLCEECTTSPSDGKDLCAEHAKRWQGPPRKQVS